MDDPRYREYLCSKTRPVSKPSKYQVDHQPEDPSLLRTPESQVDPVEVSKYRCQNVLLFNFGIGCRLSMV